MATSERKLLDALGRTPFVDSTVLALILGEPHATVHRTLSNLLAEGIVGRVSHGTAHLPSSQRYHLTTRGRQRGCGGPRLRHALGLRAGLPHVQGVADAAHPQDGRRGLRLSTRRHHVPRHRRPPDPRGVPPSGRFDAFITLHDGRSFGVVRQGLALRRRSLYDRLRATPTLPPGPAWGPPQLHPAPSLRGPVSGPVPR